MPEQDRERIRFIDGRKEVTQSSNEAITAKLHGLEKEITAIDNEPIEGEILNHVSAVKVNVASETNQPSKIIEFVSGPTNSRNALELRAQRLANIEDKKAA